MLWLLKIRCWINSKKLKKFVALVEFLNWLLSIFPFHDVMMRPVKGEWICNSMGCRSIAWTPPSKYRQTLAESTWGCSRPLENHILHLYLSTHVKINYETLAKSYLFYGHSCFPCSTSLDMTSAQGGSSVSTQTRNALRQSSYDHCLSLWRHPG